jgi:hypothetical protein
MREALQSHHICDLDRDMLNIAVDAGRTFHLKKHKYDNLIGQTQVNWFSFLDQKSSRQMVEDTCLFLPCCRGEGPALLLKWGINRGR